MSSTTAPATTPAPQNGTVPPRPVPQAQRRPREYLTPNEVERLIAAARQNRYGHRDATMIRVAYRAAGGEPVEYHPNGGEVLLDGRGGLAVAELLDVGGDVDRADSGNRGHAAG